MPKNRSQVKSKPLQGSLPGTDDTYFVLHEGTLCRCSCEACPPWMHDTFDCSKRCVGQSVPPATNRGVHGRLGNAAASALDHPAWTNRTKVK